MLVSQAILSSLNGASYKPVASRNIRNTGNTGGENGSLRTRYPDLEVLGWKLTGDSGLTGISGLA